MPVRDIGILFVGLLFALLCFVFALSGFFALAIVMSAGLNLLLLLLLVIQRRQNGKMQERLLQILQHTNVIQRAVQSEDPSMRKVIGLIGAQKTSMEILNERFESLSHNRVDKGR